MMKMGLFTWTLDSGGWLVGRHEEYFEQASALQEQFIECGGEICTLP
jgi:hypothetical protein